MITFDNWIITGTGTQPPRQHDNLTYTLTVTGRIPEGWSWELLVQAGDKFNVIPLQSAEGGSLSAALTREMLALSGIYRVQLRATREEQVRHTNVTQLFIPPSLSGDSQWPQLPTAFSQALEQIQALHLHPPIPGSDGFWMLWDLTTSTYLPSQLPLPDCGIEHSPYQIAVAGGYTGTEAEFNAALVSLEVAPFLPLSIGATKEYVDTAIFGALMGSY